MRGPRDHQSMERAGGEWARARFLGYGHDGTWGHKDGADTGTRTIPGRALDERDTGITIPVLMSKTALLTLLLLAACHHDHGAAGPMERAGKGVDTAAEKTGTALEGAAVKTGHALDSAGHATGRAFERAGSKLQGKSASPSTSARATSPPSHTPGP